VNQDFDQFWFNALNDGVISGTSLPFKDIGLNMQSLPAAQTSSPMELVFRPSPSVWDGSFANNGWLQELPQPWTRLAWDNAALMSPRTAIELLGLSIADTSNLTPEDYEALDKANGSVIELNYGGRTLLAPVWIVPGHAPDTVTLHVGYGHTDIGQVGNGVGVNAYSIRSSEQPWFAPVTATVINAQRYQLVSTQDHHSMEGRAIVRAGTLEEYQQEPGFIGALAEFPNHPERSLFQDLFPYKDGYSWGMVIDLNACIGCNTCTIACQAENNIPIVGKEEVAIGREMHWIRIDRYYGGDLENPVLYQQPMACVNCELAPCEIVCPVAATIHDAEGINNMVYNRCVGTRYCSNNCPYKVRRFNFFYYTDYLDENPSLQLQQNPDVTVRSRGVMEKCTYCIQRIKEVTIPAKNENREIADGEVIPACAQACPTQAITFGNLNDPESRVSALKKNLLNYGVLEELNFFPRTTYLGRVTNPNPIIGAMGGMEYPGTGYPYGEEHDGGHGDESESHEGESSEEHSQEQPEETHSEE
jgi:molybdopterin-containing oxidoreductase family iron-sulfur binding subunit